MEFSARASSSLRGQTTLHNKIDRMAKASKCGVTAVTITEISSVVSKKVKAHTSGLTGQSIQGRGRTTK